MRVKRQTNQCQRSRSNFRLRAGRVKKGGELKGCFGFRNRIRVERPSDIAGRLLVSTCVLKESSQNFAEFQRNVLIAAFYVVLTIDSRHFLPNSRPCGNPGSWRIVAECGILPHCNSTLQSRDTMPLDARLWRVELRRYRLILCHF